MKKAPANFGPEYFHAYAGTRDSYDQVWREHSYVEELVEQFREPTAPKIRNVYVLGMATGKVGRLLEKKLGITAWGCEFSPWAHARIPQPMRRRVRREDMRVCAQKLVAQKRKFDLLYSNSLIYLEKADLPRFLSRMAKVGRILHFNSSFAGKSCPDPARRTLETYDWWNRQLKKAGFRELRGPRGRRTYLWISERISQKA